MAEGGRRIEEGRGVAEVEKGGFGGGVLEERGRELVGDDGCIGGCDEGCLVLGRRSGEEMAGSGRRIKEGRGVTEMEDGGSAERDECCRRGGRDRQGRRGRVVLARCGAADIVLDVSMVRLGGFG